MGSTTDDAEPVHAHPLAPDLQGAAMARLDHQHRLHSSGEELDHVTGGRRANLLVGGDQQLDPGPVRQLRQRVQRLDDAGLHVEHAGAVGTAVLDAEGHALQRAHRPDRVEVAEHSHPRRPEAPAEVGTALGEDRLRPDSENPCSHAGEQLGALRDRTLIR